MLLFLSFSNFGLEIHKTLSFTALKMLRGFFEKNCHVLKISRRAAVLTLTVIAWVYGGYRWNRLDHSVLMKEGLDSLTLPFTNDL